jgi:hypothetical protein
MPCQRLVRHWLSGKYRFIGISPRGPSQAKKTQRISSAMTNKGGETPGALLRSFGGETLNMVCQVTVNLVCDNYGITAKVQVQKGAPVQFLLGSDLLPQLELGFSLLKS